MRENLMVPEVTLYNLVNGLLEDIDREFNSTADKTKTKLYRYWNGVVDGNYDYYVEAISLFTSRDVDNPRRVSCRMFFDASKARVPTMHITMPSDQTGSNSIGVDELGSVSDIYISDNEATPTLGRRFDSQFSVICTSENNKEVLLMYHTLRAMIISAHRSLDFAGMQNLKISGQEIRLRGEDIPNHIFMRGLGLTFSYDIRVPNLFSEKIVNQYALKGRINIDEGSVNVPIFPEREICRPLYMVSNSNNTYSVEVLATDDLVLPDVTHTQSDGSPLVLPAITPVVCTPVSPSIVRNSDRSFTRTLSSGSTLELPDSMVSVNGNLLNNLPATSNLNIPIVDSNNVAIGEVQGSSVVVDNGEWVRPSSWPVQPVPETQEVAMLMRLEGNYNIDTDIAFRSFGEAELWIDDTMVVGNIANNAVTTFTVNSDDHGFFKDGVKWAWIKIRAQSGSNLLGVNFSNSTNTSGVVTDMNIQEMIVNLPNSRPLQPIIFPLLSAAQLQLQRLIHVQINTIGTVTSCSNMFQTAPSLIQVTNFDLLTQNAQFSNRIFQRGTRFAQREFNFPLVTQLEAFAVFNGNIGSNHYVRFNTSSALTRINGAFQNGSSWRGIEFTECSGVALGASAFTNCFNLQRLILPNMSASFSMNNCRSMNEDALLDLVTSLADLSGQPTRTITLTGSSQFASVDALASSKNWTTTY